MPEKTIIPSFLFVLFFIVLITGCNNKETGKKESSKEDWVSLFNGKDLTGWDIKIKDHPMNENYKNTFRVEDSMLRVSYSEYEKFDNQFGHLFTQIPYHLYS